MPLVRARLKTNLRTTRHEVPSVWEREWGKCVLLQLSNFGTKLDFKIALIFAILYTKYPYILINCMVNVFHGFFSLHYARAYCAYSAYADDKPKLGQQNSTQCHVQENHLLGCIKETLGYFLRLLMQTYC